MSDASHGLVIRRATIVRPGSDTTEVGDLAITDGAFTAVGGTVPGQGSREN